MSRSILLQTTKSLALSCLLLSTNSQFTLAQNSMDWQALPNMPVGKWEPGVVILDDKLYLFGGYTEGVVSSKRSEYFDPEDGSWTLIQELPSAITHMNMVLDGRTVWFAGGFKDGYRGHTIAEVWNYDIDLDRYTAAPLLPGPRAGGGLALVGRELHYFGGLMVDRDTDSADHWVLNLDDWAKGSARWEPSIPMPTPRNQFSTIVFQGNIYAIGPPLPKGHSHAEGATFVHANKIWMIGGHTTPAGGTKSQDPDILTLAPEGQWQKVGELPNPLSSPAAGIIDGMLYVAGGAFEGSTVQAKMWIGEVP